MIDTTKEPYVLPVLFAEGDEGVQYRWLVDLPGYAIGDDGSVWTCWNKHGGVDKTSRMVGRWRRCGLSRRSDRYPVVFIRTRKKQLLLHRLVLFAFLGPPPEGQEGCHNNGNRDDASLSNLRWDTHDGNMLDTVAHGTSVKGERSGRALVTEQDVVEIRNIYAHTEVSASELAKQYGVTKAAITAIVAWRSWTHIGGDRASDDVIKRKVAAMRIASRTIDEETAKRACDMVKGGMSCMAAARAIGCNHATLRRELARRNCKSKYSRQ